MNASKNSQIGGMSPICTPVYEFGQFRLESDNRLLLRGDQTVALTPKAFDTLLFLVERHGRLVSKDELISAVWAETAVCESNLTQTIFMLRKALGESASEQKHIVTVPGSGYRFVGVVETTSEEETGPVPDVVAERNVPRHTHWKIVTVALAAGIILFGVLFRAMAPLPNPSVKRVSQLPVSNYADPWQNLISDGARLVFLESTGNHSELVQTSVAGGDTRPLAQPFPNIKILAVSPDRADFLIIRDESRGNPAPLYVWPVQGGAPARVGNIMTRDASWTQDGEVIYVNGGDIRKVRRDGSDDRLLLHTSGLPLWMRFSPDGKIIRFTLAAHDGYKSEIWEANNDGTGAHRYHLTGEQRECCGDWIGDGRYFVFTVYSGGMANLWAVREKGKGIHLGAGRPVQLTSGTNSLFDAVPVGENRIYSFVQAPTGESTRYDLKTHEFIGLFPGKQIMNLGYSPDAQRVAYQSETDGSLWVSKPDGSEAREIVVPPDRAGNPRWSPDSLRIAFEGHAPGKWLKALVVNADGGPVERVLPGDEPQGLPSWSPDGKSIAVAVDVFGTASPAGRRGIFIVDWQTRNATKLEGSEGLTDPLWSPDGKYFIARSPDNRDILEWQPGMKKWTLLVRGRQLAGPVWSPDSKYLYYQDVLETGQPIYRLEMGKTQPERVVSFEKLLAGGVQQCIFQSMTPDGGLVVYLRHSYARVHALDLNLP